VTLSSTLLGALLLLVAAACGREPEPSLGKLPASKGPTPETILRVPRQGGKPLLYRVPALQPSSWKAEDTLPRLERTIGADAEQGVVFLLDQKRNIDALDLETRRVRPSLEQVRRATLGPDGALYVIDTGSTVTQLVRRAPVRFRSKLEGTPGELHATMAGALLAKVSGKRPALEVLGSDQAPVSMPIPAGDLAPSLWGDVVAVAADTAVVVYETQGKRSSRSIRVPDHARAVLFSPSGHRLYVAQESDKLLVFDRFSGAILGQIDLPNSARALRGDRYGQWLLVRPEVGDSVWVIDVGRGQYVGSAASQWADDLPAVASPATLLLRQDKDVVARDLSAKGLPITGKVEGAADFWLPLAWRPAQDIEVPIAADSNAIAAASDTSAAPSVYLQVSSSQNPGWANELSQKLRTAGLPATVLAPKRSDEAYRVVLGPYATREQAEATGRKIGMPSFIVTAQDVPTP
jgi:hypothetical protein